MTASPPPALRVLERCLGCGGARLAPLPLAYEHGGAHYPAAECRGCGLRFLRVQPAGETLAALYAEAYFAADYRCGRAAAHAFDETGQRPESDGLLDAFAALTPPGRLLEVGCAGGWLLRHAAERGWSVRGVEPSRAAVEHARGLGLDVVQGGLEAAALPAGHFDLVYMGDVLEHVPDCRATLAEVARVLCPGGWLYLRGPITTHSLARSLALALCRLAGRTIVLREPPYHLWEFTPGPLRRLVAAAGLEIVSLRQSKIQPGGARAGRPALQRVAMAAIDTVNWPLTRIFNVRGDRVTLIARRPPR